MQAIIDSLRQNLPPMILGAIALGAVALTAGLVAYDVMLTPLRQPQPLPAAAAAPLPATSPAAVEQAARAHGEKTDLTLFRRTPVKLGARTYAVVVGTIYPTLAAEKPSRAFCYIEGAKLSDNAEVTVQLARHENGRVLPTTISDKDAAAIGLSAKDLMEATAACKFI
jgi:hypothetical protein